MPSAWFRDTAVLVKRAFRLDAELAREAQEEAIELLQAMRDDQAR